MFSYYKYLIVNLVFPPRFLELKFISDAPFTGHCLVYLLMGLLSINMCLRFLHKCTHFIYQPQTK